MANYATGDSVVAQRFLNEQFASPEKRTEQAVVFNMFIASNRLFEMTVDKTSDDRPSEAHYMTKRVRALGTSGRVRNHTGSTGDSAKITPTWITRDATWSENLKLADNKIWTAQDLMNNEMLDAFISFEEGKEILAVDHLFNNRSQVNIATLEGTFDATFHFKITEATNGNRKAQITKSVMSKNKYATTGLIYVCDTISFNKFEFDAAQGTGNSENLSFQYQGVTFIKSTRMDVHAATLSITKGLWAVAPFGTFGLADWIPLQNRQGITTTVSKYSTIINPNDGLSYAMHSYEARVDGSGIGSQTQDVKIEHELSIDWAFDNAPLSTANESTIQFFSLV